MESDASRGSGQERAHTSRSLRLQPLRGSWTATSEPEAAWIAPQCVCMCVSAIASLVGLQWNPPPKKKQVILPGVSFLEDLFGVLWQFCRICGEVQHR